MFKACAILTDRVTKRYTRPIRNCELYYTYILGSTSKDFNIKYSNKTTSEIQQNLNSVSSIMDSHNKVNPIRN